MRGLRMPPELEARIDDWIERQPEPKPSRSEAIRRLVERGLDTN
jgi:Arc/MetJ-type ribon-helix-helix transcriptional regulator